MSKFEVTTHKSNHTGSLPAHHDIHENGATDSLITVWANQETAEYIAKALERREAIEDLFMYLDRPGLIGG